MNEVGISSASFFSKALTEDSLKIIKDCGADCAEVFLTTFSEYTEEFGRLLKERKAETGLKIYSVHSLNTTFEPQLFGIAERTRKDAEQTYFNVLARAKDLGAQVYTFHGQTRLKKTSFIDAERFGRRFEELALQAADFGVKLCLENVHWATFNAPEFFEAMRVFAPHAGTVLDIKQAWQSGRDWKEYVDVMGDTLSNIHICDCHEDEKTCMVGDGVFDFEALVPYVVKRGYKGPFIIEQYAKDYEDKNKFVKAVAHIKNIVEATYATQI